MERRIKWAAIVVMFFGLAGCGTLAGLGRDMQAVGQLMETVEDNP